MEVSNVFPPNHKVYWNFKVFYTFNTPQEKKSIQLLKIPIETVETGLYRNINIHLLLFTIDWSDFCKKEYGMHRVMLNSIALPPKKSYL